MTQLMARSAENPDVFRFFVSDAIVIQVVDREFVDAVTILALITYSLNEFLPLPEPAARLHVVVVVVFAALWFAWTSCATGTGFLLFSFVAKKLQRSRGFVMLPLSFEVAVPAKWSFVFHEERMAIQPFMTSRITFLPPEPS